MSVRTLVLAVGLAVDEHNMYVGISDIAEESCKAQAGNMHLEVDHVPEALQVSSGYLLLSSAIFTVLHQSSKLLESLRHQQLCLANRCSDTAENYSHNSSINTVKDI